MDFRNVPNLHLQQLAYLREVERASTWSEAAIRLHVSQPALSQSLRELERRLGVELFEREGRTHRLSPAGREMAAFARETLSAAGAVMDRLAGLQAGRSGTLRVGMIDAASLYVLPEAVRAFRREHSHVRLEVLVASSGILLDHLRRFELDLAFVTGPAEVGLRGEAIFEEPLYVYAPKGSRQPPQAAEWVLYPPGSHTRREIDAGFLAWGVQPNVVLESGNPEVLRQMVALGLGWSVLPSAVAAPDGPRLRRLRRGPLARRSLVAVVRERAPEDPRVTALVGLAQRHARGRSAVVRS